MTGLFLDKMSFRIAQLCIVTGEPVHGNSVNNTAVVSLPLQFYPIKSCVMAGDDRDIVSVTLPVNRNTILYVFSQV